MTAIFHPAEADVQGLKRTARLAGLFYLGLCIAGALSFFLIRGRIFDAGSAAATLDHLAGQQLLARLGIVAEMAVVLTQAFLALWLYRLFRSVDAFMAGAVAAFGLINAVAILASAALLATATDLAANASVADPASAAQLLYIVSGHLWGVGGLFFGLWLIPMGALVLRSRWMPMPLAWLLIAGGIGYVLNTFVVYLVPNLAVVTGVLPLIATVGELWMLGYLLIRGIRVPAAPLTAPITPAA